MSEVESAQQALAKKLAEGEKVLGKKNEGAESYLYYQNAFIEKVDQFQQLAVDPSLSLGSLPSAKAHFEQGETEVEAILKRACVAGNGLLLSAEKGETTAESRKQAAVNLNGMAEGLIGFMSPYKDKLKEIGEVENIEKETEKALSYSKEPFKNEMAQLLNLPSEYFEKVAAGVIKCGEGRDLIDTGAGLPEPFRSERREYFDRALEHFKRVIGYKAVYDRIGEKKWPHVEISINLRTGEPKVILGDEFKNLPQEKQDEILKDLAVAKLRAEQQVEVAASPKIMANYYIGLALFEQGILEEATVKLKQFTEKDVWSPEMQAHPEYWAKKEEFAQKGKELLALIDKQLKGNVDFYEGQKLAQSGNLIEAKNRLKKFLAEHGNDKPSADQSIDYPKAAKGLLKQIAQVQLEELRAKVADFPEPQYFESATYGGADVDKLESPQHQRWADMRAKVSQLEKLFAGGEVLDLSEFIEKNFPNLEPGSVLRDVIVEEKEGREGWLKLARKYRAMGRTEIARRYFAMYFKERMSKKAQEVTVDKLEKKYDSNKNFHGEITKKEQAVIDEYKTRFGDRWEEQFKKHEKETGMSVRKEIETRALQEILPKEVMQAQQENTAEIPPAELDAWNEFSQMEGVKPRTIAGVETFAIRDEEIAPLIAEIVIAVAITAASAGVASVGAAAVSRGVVMLGARVGMGAGTTTLLAGATGFAAESALFSLSSVTLNAIKDGRFSLNNIGTDFSNEIWHGTAVLGAFKMIGVIGKGFAAGSRLTAAAERGGVAATRGSRAAQLAVGASSLADQMVGMAIVEGDLNVNNAAMVLGLALVHSKTAQKAAGKHTRAKEAQLERMRNTSAIVRQNFSEMGIDSPQKIRQGNMIALDEGGYAIETRVNGTNRAIRYTAEELRYWPKEYRARIIDLEARNDFHQDIRQSKNPEADVKEYNRKNKPQPGNAFEKVYDRNGKVIYFDAQGRMEIADALHYDRALDDYVAGTDAKQKGKNNSPGRDRVLEQLAQMGIDSPDKIGRLIEEKDGSFSINTGNKNHVIILPSDLRQLPMEYRVKLLNNRTNVRLRDAIRRSNKSPEEAASDYNGQYGPQKNRALEKVYDGSAEVIYFDENGLLKVSERQKYEEALYQHVRDICGTEIHTAFADTYAQIKAINAEYKKNTHEGPAEKPDANSLYQRLKNLEEFNRNRPKPGTPERAEWRERLGRRIAELRTEMAERNKVLRSVNEKLESTIRDLEKNKPDRLTADNVLSALDYAELRKTFSESEIRKIENTARELIEKSRAVTDYYENYKDRPAELFKLVFSREPQGQVRLVKTTFGLGFICELNADFYRSGGSLGGAGVAFGNSEIVSIEALRGTVMSMKGVDEYSKPRDDASIRDTITHEERHNINGFIFSALGTESHVPLGEFPNVSGDAAARRIFDGYLRQTVTNACDEILAYMSDGTIKSETRRKLTNPEGIYNYWETIEQKSVAQSAADHSSAPGGFRGNDNQKISQLFPELVQEYKKRHFELVERAVDAAYAINDPFLLSVTPVSEWRNIYKTVAAYDIESQFNRANLTPQQKAELNSLLSEFSGAGGGDLSIIMDPVTGAPATKYATMRDVLASQIETVKRNAAERGLPVMRFNAEDGAPPVRAVNTEILSNLRQQYPKDIGSAYVIRGQLPDGAIIAHNSTGELVIFANAAQLELCRQKLSPDRLGQDGVDAPTVAERVDVLRTQAEKAKADFDGVTASVAGIVGALELHNASVGGRDGNGVALKERDQAIKKVEGPFKGNERFMTDLLRGTIVVSDVPSMSRVVEALMADPRVQSISVQNRINWNGCNDMLVNIKLKNGHTAELQLHVPEIRTAINEGVRVPADVIRPEEFNFSADEIALVESLKSDAPGRRTLRGDIRLPVYGEPLSSHKLYEIVRSLPEANDRTPFQKALNDRINGLINKAHDYAKKQYSARTGMDFGEDFHL